MMFGAWGNPDHDDSIRIIHAALDAGDQLRRHRRRLLGRRVGGDRRQGAQGPPRRRRARDQVLHADGRGPQPARRLAALDHHARSRTRCGGSGPTGSTSTRSTAPTRRSTSRRRSARSPTSSSRARSAPSAPRRTPASEIVEAQWAARERDLERFRTEQPPYSLLVRGIELDVLPTAAAPRHGHPHLQPALRRLAVGQLDARTAPRPRPRASGSPRASTCRCPRTSASSTPSRQLAQVADDAGLTHDRAGDRVRRQPPGVTSAIIGPRTMEQLESQLPGRRRHARRGGARPHRRDRQARRQPQPRPTPATASRCSTPALRRR